MMSQTERFFEDYDVAAGRLNRSVEGTLTANLRRLRTTIEAFEPAKTLVDQLSSQGDFAGWLETFQATPEHDPIAFAGNEIQELATKVLILWEMEKRTDLALELGGHFTTVNNFDHMVRAVLDHEVQHTVSDLRRFLADRLERAADDFEVEDREIITDQTDPNWQRVIEAIDRVADAVRSQNDISLPDRERREAELESGMILIKAPRFSRLNVMTILGRCLRYLAEQFRDSAVGATAYAALIALLDLLDLPMLLGMPT